MIIAVTGSEGFVGKRLVSSLRQSGHTLRVLDCRKHDIEKPESLPSFLTGTGCVIHLAAVNRDSNARLVRVNTAGTVGILDAMEKYSPKAKLIFASSFQVYVKNNYYALSKSWAEEAIHHSAKAGGIRAVILRIANIFGPGCRPYYNSVIATYIHQITKGEPLIVHGDGSQKRDYIYVNDVVEAFEKSISSVPRDPVETYDICSGNQVALSEIIAILQSIHKNPLRVEYKNSTGTGAEYPDKDFAHAQNALSWKPKTPLQEGLTTTLHYEAQH